MSVAHGAPPQDLHDWVRLTTRIDGIYQLPAKLLEAGGPLPELGTVPRPGPGLVGRWPGGQLLYRNGSCQWCYSRRYEWLMLWHSMAILIEIFNDGDKWLDKQHRNGGSILVGKS